MKKLIAIDPGNEMSGLAILDANTYTPLYEGKHANQEIMRMFATAEIDIKDARIVIEELAHYGTGMPAGKTVFDTAKWIGRYIQFFVERGFTVELLPRTTVKTHLCGTPRAKDGNVIQSLVDRFAPNTPNKGKGVKKTPGYFYGFSADMWQAYALGVVYLDIKKGKNGGF